MTDSPPTPGTVVLLASDLMLSSTVSGHAATSGCEFRSASTPADVENLLKEQTNVLLLVDLGLAGLDVADLASRLPDDVRKTAVAYGPHVHAQKLQAAQQAGLGRVMSRGAFSAGAGQMIADFAATTQNQSNGSNCD
ncbi:hypothetical protein [Fuerstiella marisgermanici]|nr:hypothetical protein [Fuerstiella marisgermanici]